MMQKKKEASAAAVPTLQPEQALLRLLPACSPGAVLYPGDTRESTMFLAWLLAGDTPHASSTRS